jgi:hypothetical protein
MHSGIRDLRLVVEGPCRARRTERDRRGQVNIIGIGQKVRQEGRARVGAPTILLKSLVWA